jgi:transcription antitermination factor NusG
LQVTTYHNKWLAVQVKPKYEFTSSSILRGKGYEDFVPTYRVTRKWADRTKEVETPLFPGYIFCRFNEDLPWTIVTTPGVVRVVKHVNQIAIIDDMTITALRSLVRLNVPLKPCPYLAIGDRVRVKQGPLTGVEGLLLRHKTGGRLVISVDLIQRSMSVEVHDCDVVAA